MTTNPNVIREAVQLAKALATEGINVQIAYVLLTGLAKAGFDDWAASTHPALKEATKTLRQRATALDAQIEWAVDQNITGQLVAELATWAYVWLDGDDRLFQTYAKKASSTLNVSVDRFTAAVEPIADQTTTDLVVRAVHLNAFLVRHRNTEPFGLEPIQPADAASHLIKVGGLPRRQA